MERFHSLDTGFALLPDKPLILLAGGTCTLTVGQIEITAGNMPHARAVLRSGNSYDTILLSADECHAIKARIERHTSARSYALPALEKAAKAFCSYYGIQEDITPEPAQPHKNPARANSVYAKTRFKGNGSTRKSKISIYNRAAPEYQEYLDMGVLHPWNEIQETRKFYFLDDPEAERLLIGSLIGLGIQNAYRVIGSHYLEREFSVDQVLGLVISSIKGALPSFEPQLGNRLSTYIPWKINNDIEEYIRINHYGLVLSRFRQFMKIRRYAAEHTLDLSKERDLLKAVHSLQFKRPNKVTETVEFFRRYMGSRETYDQQHEDGRFTRTSEADPVANTVIQRNESDDMRRLLSNVIGFILPHLSETEKVYLGMYRDCILGKYSHSQAARSLGLSRSEFDSHIRSLKKRMKEIIAQDPDSMIYQRLMSFLTIAE